MSGRGKRSVTTLPWYWHPSLPPRSDVGAGGQGIRRRNSNNNNGINIGIVVVISSGINIFTATNSQSRFPAHFSFAAACEIRMQHMRFFLEARKQIDKEDTAENLANSTSSSSSFIIVGIKCEILHLRSTIRRRSRRRGRRRACRRWPRRTRPSWPRAAARRAGPAAAQTDRSPRSAARGSSRRTVREWTEQT